MQALAGAREASSHGRGTAWKSKRGLANRFVLTALLLFDAGPIFAWILAGSMLLLNLGYVTFTFLQIGTEVVHQHAEARPEDLQDITGVARSVALKACTAALTSRLAKRCQLPQPN